MAKTDKIIAVLFVVLIASVVMFIGWVVFSWIEVLIKHLSGDFNYIGINFFVLLGGGKFL